VYLHGREMSPKGELWDRAVNDWRALFDNADCRYDRDLEIDCSQIKPQVTWGTTPQDVIAVDAAVPDPASATDPARRAMMERAIGYIGLTPGQPIAGTPIDVAFIGSCTNGRLSDLQAAADVARGRKVAGGVRALVVPGAAHVKAAAEALGLDKVFLEAGFEWRESACSMCVAAGGDIVPPGQRSISTSNRNFEGRQGPGARTHLASPAMVAAAAVTGCITDVRTLLS
jgi:3-isopropylmalate/(R)-2-methylmalate dehydratase large subunit